MNTPLASLHKAKGNVLVMVTLSLFVILGMAGLAIDLSHTYTNKTQMQNLADALALSAAISINKQNDSSTNTDEIAAENYAKNNSFEIFKNSPGNCELFFEDCPKNQIIRLAAGDINIYFAKISNLNTSSAGDWKAANAINDANFVRVVVNHPTGIATWFARVIGFNNLAVSTTAVAGTAPINPCDNVIPIMMCTETNNPNVPPDSEGSRIDTNCNNNNDNSGFSNSNNDCYGYERDVVYGTKLSDWKIANVGPGNFGYFDVGSGGSAVKECLAGEPDCSANLCNLLDDSDPTLTSEPGNKVGPGEQGLNTRFDDYKGSMKYNGIFPLPDSLVSNNLGTTLSTTARDPGQEFNTAKGYTTPPSANPSAQIYNTYYKDHYTTTNDLSSGHKFIPGRRLVVMPFVACPGNTNGKKDLEIVGFGCWFLTSPSDGKIIYQEFLGKEGEGCNVNGTTTSTNSFGFYKVQLYKDPFGGHS